MENYISGTESFSWTWLTKSIYISIHNCLLVGWTSKRKNDWALFFCGICNLTPEKVYGTFKLKICNEKKMLILIILENHQLLVWRCTGCPKKHGNSVTNLISSLLWISIVIPNFKTHNIIMSARVYFMKRVRRLRLGRQQLKAKTIIDREGLRIALNCFAKHCKHSWRFFSFCIKIPWNKSVYIFVERLNTTWGLI